jgi:hypothetical protein
VAKFASKSDHHVKFCLPDVTLKLVVDWWRQVGLRYRGYPPLLSFDIIIEVTDALNKLPDMLNKLYAAVVPELRKTNPTRCRFYLKVPEYFRTYFFAEIFLLPEISV